MSLRPEESALRTAGSLQTGVVTHATVFFTGAAVLVLEIIGTRFLAPFYGSNLYSWSALISVTLLALALGYYLGGRLADARGSPALLDAVIALSAACVAAVPPLAHALADPLAAAGPRLGVLASALVSFGPSLTLLGMITPIAVRLAAPDFAHLGRSVGSVYASSTAGSIAGALVAGFLLLPAVRVSRICYAVALFLAALAAARALARTRLPALGLLPAIAAAAWGALSSAAPAAQPEAAGNFRVTAVYPSFYGTVKVLEDSAVRYLVIDGMCHNAQAIADRTSVLPYVSVFGVLPYLDPAGRDLLLIGLGAGDMVRLLGEFGIRTTAVEIDPVVAQAAFRHFGLRPDELELVLDDGRAYLRRAPARYDFLIVDAFAGGSPAAHLFSREAFADMRAALREGGVLGVNIIARSTADPLVADLEATIGAVFPYRIAVSTAHRPTELGNIIFFASDRPIELPSRLEPPPADARLKRFLESLPGMRLDAIGRKGRVLTDDFNPLEALAAPTEEAMRRAGRAAVPASVLAP
jgi:predicted membrane-bound spermidine synthase